MKSIKLKYRYLTIKIPSRCIFNLASFDILNGFGGGYGIALSTNSRITIKYCKGSSFCLNKEFESLVLYYLNIFKNGLKINDNFCIDFCFDERIELHSGFASNMMIASSLIYALNAIYDYPLTMKKIEDIIKQNYIEKNSEHTLTKTIFTGNSLYNILYGGLNIVDKYKNLYKRFVIDYDFKCIIIKSGVSKFISNEQELHMKAMKNDISFADKREKIIFEILPELIKKEDYSKIAYYTNFIQINGAQKIFRNNLYSNYYSLNRLNHELESNNFIYGFTNSFDIFVLTKNISKVETICEKYKLSYFIFNIDNNGLKVESVNTNIKVV